MRIKLLLAILLITFTSTLNAQDFSKDNFENSVKSNSNLESKFINDVFVNNVAEDTQHYKNLLEILRDRVVFLKLKNDKGEKYTKLSEIELFNKYNTALKRDSTFDSITFNVLKYNLNFYSINTKIYRIDNTEWVIVIQPSNK